jgi:adenylate cyclase
VVQRRAFTRRAVRALAVVVVLALVAVRWWDPTAIQIVRHKSFDLYQRTYAPEPFDSPVTLVAIDGPSLKAHGPWPWPRTLIADLTAAIDDAGASAIAFDMVFAETDRSSPSFIARTLRNADAATIEALAQMPDHDSVLAAQLGATPSVLGQSPVTDATTVGAASWPLKASMAVRGPDPAGVVPHYSGWARNLAELEDAARGLGALALEADPDGVVRRPPLLVATENQLYPSLALEAIRVAVKAPGFEIRTLEDGVESITVGALLVPTDRRGRLWLRALPATSIPTVSAAAVMEGDPGARAAIKGRIALVGVSAPGLADIKPAARGALSSTQIQAMAIMTMQSGDFPHRPAWTAPAEITAVGLIGLVLAIVLPSLGVGWAAAAAVLLAGGYGAGSWLLFRREGVLLDSSFALAATIMIFLVLVAAEQLRERSRRRDIKMAFAQYLAPALVDRLADRPEALELGGIRREMTFMFADIRGFATISERFAEDPQGLTRLINLYLTAMGDRLLEHRATIDKYMGDAIMAFWNAPLADPNHARDACLAALEMIHGLRKLNLKLLEDPTLGALEGEALEIGIGINTGTCLVGNVGSKHRFNYSVIGDAVNVASRLEELAPTYGVRIVVGEAARTLVDGLAFLEIDTLQVKGRGGAETAYALLGGKDLAEDSRFPALERAQTTLLAAMRGGDAARTRQGLAQCRALADGLADALAHYEVDLTRLYAHYEERLTGDGPAPGQSIASGGARGPGPAS